MKATGEFAVASWNQADLEGVWDGRQVMKVEAAFEASGGISGSGRYFARDGKMVIELEYSLADGR